MIGCDLHVAACEGILRCGHVPFRCAHDVSAFRLGQTLCLGAPATEPAAETKTIIARAAAPAQVPITMFVRVPDCRLSELDEKVTHYSVVQGAAGKPSGVARAPTRPSAR